MAGPYNTVSGPEGRGVFCIGVAMPVWTLAASILLLSAAAPVAAADQQGAAATAPVPVRLPRGTAVRVAFQYGVSSRAAREGDKVYLRVVEPVLYKGEVVIPVDATVEALVTRARAPGDYGGAGALQIDAEFVRIGDDRIPLQGSIGSEAAASRATAGQGVVTVPFGSLRRGKSANIEAGTVFIVTTIRDY